MAEIETENVAARSRYKIGDVCRLADVQPYVLRYWESEFSVLSPDRSQSGPRTYTARELKIIEQIKRLLYDEGYTIAGAKKRLETEALASARAEVHQVQEAEEAQAVQVRDAETAREKQKERDRERKPARAKPAPTLSVDTLPGLGVSPPPLPASAVSDTAPVAAVPAVKSDAPPWATPDESRPTRSDPRVTRAVTELKAILQLLS